MRRWIAVLTLALVFVASVAHAVTADELMCEARLYGTIDNLQPPFPPGPLPRLDIGESAQRAPALMTRMFGAAIRRPFVISSPLPSPYQWTHGTVNLRARLEDGTALQLGLTYLHAVKLGADSKPERAAQLGTLWGYASKMPGGLSSGQVILMPNLNTDPFDPASGFKEVKIIDGVPAAEINETKWVEIPSGSGVVKLQCSTVPSVGPLPKP